MTRDQLATFFQTSSIDPKFAAISSWARPTARGAPASSTPSPLGAGPLPAQGPPFHLSFLLHI